MLDLDRRGRCQDEKSSQVFESKIVIISTKYERYPLSRPFSKGVMLEIEGWWSYCNDDGVVIPSEVIKEEAKVLLWKIVKWQPLVGSKGVG